MGNYLDKDGLTRFKTKLLTEVDKRIASGGGSTSGGDIPTKEEIIEGATRVTDVDVNAEVATVERLQTAVSAMESNLGGLDDKLDKSTFHIVESWSSGTSWCRKYSNGFIEQGGVGNTVVADGTNNVTLLTPFSNNTYVVVGSSIRRADFVFGVTSQSTTSFLCGLSQPGITWASGTFSWYACGY